jgi:aldehyde:ferredoxin oxidoreductase
MTRPVGFGPHTGPPLDACTGRRILLSPLSGRQPAGTLLPVAQYPAGANPLGPDNTLTFASAPPPACPSAGRAAAPSPASRPAPAAWPTARRAASGRPNSNSPASTPSSSRERPIRPFTCGFTTGRSNCATPATCGARRRWKDDALLKAEVGDRQAEIAQIGPAGEKLSNFAAIMNMSNRAWGRTGVGAVMGSKKLKAIVVRGTQKAVAADKTAVALARHAGRTPTPGSDYFGRYGTATHGHGQHGGGRPAHPQLEFRRHGQHGRRRSHQRRTLYDVLLRGAAEGKQDKLGRDTCYACIVRCKRVVEASGATTPSNPNMAARNTKPSPPSALTAASPTCTPSPMPTSCATNMA